MGSTAGASSGDAGMMATRKLTACCFTPVCLKVKGFGHRDNMLLAVFPSGF